MTDTNFTVLIGRLVRDIDLKYTPSGKAVSKFSIAVNDKRKADVGWKDKTDFFEVVIWGKLGESLKPYLAKGKQVAVTGKLTQERWCDNDGQNRSKVVVTASTVQLIGGNTKKDNNSNEDYFTPPGASDGFAEDIPF